MDKHIRLCAQCFIARVLNGYENLKIHQRLVLKLLIYESKHPNMGAPSKDSDQLRHLPSLIRVFTLHLGEITEPSFLHVTEKTDQTGQMP